MDVKKKLVELLYAAHCKTAYVPAAQMYEKGVYYPEKLFEEADHLLANGVTVQEWIPVTDDSPKNGVKVLIANEDIVRRGYRRPDGVWKYGAKLHERWDKLSLFPPTHWMPLPMPPKGGKQQ